MAASPIEEAPGASGLMDGIPADRQDAVEVMMAGLEEAVNG